MVSSNRSADTLAAVYEEASKATAGPMARVEVSSQAVDAAAAALAEARQLRRAFLTSEGGTGGAVPGTGDIMPRVMQLRTKLEAQAARRSSSQAQQQRAEEIGVPCSEPPPATMAAGAA